MKCDKEGEGVCWNATLCYIGGDGAKYRIQVWHLFWTAPVYISVRVLWKIYWKNIYHFIVPYYINSLKNHTENVIIERNLNIKNFNLNFIHIRKINVFLLVLGFMGNLIIVRFIYLSQIRSNWLLNLRKLNKKKRHFAIFYYLQSILFAHLV